MRIAMLIDQSGSMNGTGDALAKAFCIAATPQTVQDGEMTLITFGRDAQVKCVDAAYVDFMDYILKLEGDQGSTNLDAALVEVNKLGKFEYIYVLCDGYPNGGRSPLVVGGPVAKEVQQTILNTKELVCIYIAAYAGGGPNVPSGPQNPLEEYVERIFPAITNEPTVHFSVFGFPTTGLNWNPPAKSFMGYPNPLGFYSEDQS